MTLRATLEIVPFGDEDRKRQIFRLDISNVGTIRDDGFGHKICRYRVSVFDDDESPFRVFEIPEFGRRDGAIALVGLACKMFEQLE